MASGGGTFLTHNKVLPGAYINFISKARALGTMGERGVVALPLAISWGETGKIVNITADDFQTNSLKVLGYDYTADELINLREVFLGAKEIRLYRLAGGEKAVATIGGLTIKAKYGGIRGNDIKIKIENSVDEPTRFNVYTYIGQDLTLVDEQSVTGIEELEANDFVTFSGNGDLEATAGTNLAGGTDDDVTGSHYQSFLNALESVDYTTIVCNTDDNTTKSLFASFIKRMRDEVGYKATLVLHNYKKADFEGVISVKNEVEVGEYNGKNDLVYWVAGQTAGAEVNESLTNRLYTGELNLLAEYTNSQLTECINNGEFTLYNDRNGYRVLKDINTFISYESSKNSDFSNNQIIRVLDSVANDVARIFSTYYLGKEQNDKTGRDIFKVEIINYIEQLQGIRAVTNFSSDDVSVEKGAEKGDVIVNLTIEPVGAMDKLYMSCIVE